MRVIYNNGNVLCSPPILPLLPQGVTVNEIRFHFFRFYYIVALFSPHTVKKPHMVRSDITESKLDLYNCDHFLSMLSSTFPSSTVPLSQKQKT